MNGVGAKASALVVFAAAMLIASCSGQSGASDQASGSVGAISFRYPRSWRGYDWNSMSSNGGPRLALTSYEPHSQRLCEQPSDLPHTCAPAIEPLAPGGVAATWVEQGGPVDYRVQAPNTTI